MSESAIPDVVQRPATTWVRSAIDALPGQLLVLAQLVALWLVVRAFAIESPAFERVFRLVIVGYALQMLAPVQLRLPLFAALSAAAAVIVFGVAQAGWLIGIGLALIGLAHLPVPFGARVVSILVAGVALALFRSGTWSPPWSPVIWPIFGAMFMFRLIVYLYDLRNRAAPFGFWRAVSYFFMLPTVCFPLFPVVDYKTMWRTWTHGKDELRVHQTGADWILRGLVQLILYRLVYQSITVDAASVQSASSALLYLVRPFLLYLRISGSFHLVIGVMHLYGFDLPRTSHNYFLASSFTDYWRRINIYWKDFLQKIFFNPVYFRLNRRLGATASLVIATLVAFFVTWALHSYQWFWIRREFPVVWQDIAFWSAMGLLVLVNMLIEARRGRRRRLSQPARSWRTELGLAARTVGTFAVIAFGWAVWSARSFTELRSVLAKLTVIGPADVAWILAGVCGFGIAAIVYERREQHALHRAGSQPAVLRAGPLRLPWTAIRVGTVAVGLLGLVYSALVFFYPPAFADVVDRMKNPLRLSRGDAALMDRGYYEELTDVARFSPELAQIYAQKPADWERCWAFHRIEAFPTYVLLPSRRVSYMGEMMSTNRWAMRDRDYELEKPPATLRMALLGESHGMGGGVPDSLTYENVAEDRLNAGRRPGDPHYEILNFSRAGYGPAARLWLLENSVWKFKPDVVLLSCVNDLYWIGRDISTGATGRYPQPFPAMAEAAHAAGIEGKTSYEVAEMKIKPFREQALRAIYSEFLRTCHEHGARAVAVFIPQPLVEAPEYKLEKSRAVEIARESGLETIDLLDVYDSTTNLPSLWVAPWDRHPNIKGHAILAERLFKELKAKLNP